MSNPQKPSVGRIVHYVSYGTPPKEDGTQVFDSRCRAATVTEIDQDDVGRVGLVALNPTGMFFHALADGGCYQNEQNHEGGTWHWPERVE